MTSAGRSDKVRLPTTKGNDMHRMIDRIKDMVRHDCTDPRFYCGDCLDDKQRAGILDLSGRPTA